MLAISGAFLFGGESARATDTSWTGATDTTWGTNSNWNPGVKPGAGDTAVFDGTFSNQPNLIANQSFGGIWMKTGVGQDVTISGSSNQITLTTNTIDGTAGLGILVDNISSHTLTISPSIKIGTPQRWLNNSGNLLSVGDIYTNARDLTIDGSGNTLVSGIISSTGAITKAGDGTLELSSANTFTGSTIVNGGILKLSAGSGSALGSTPSITVNAGGIVLLGASNQINNSASLNLAGGTFDKGNFSEGAAGAFGMAGLNVTADGSHIDFGINLVGVLSFASFNPNGHTLTIDNWTGTPNLTGDASTDRLIFASDQSSNLAYFAFTDYVGATQLALGGGYFEITPFAIVPEPATCFTALFALGVLGFEQCRRRRRSQRTSKTSSHR